MTEFTGLITINKLRSLLAIFLYLSPNDPNYEPRF